MTPVTQRRLRDGATAKELEMPEDEDGLRSYRMTLRDGILALQSLDDLGSPEANQRAWDDMLELQYRMTECDTRLKKFSDG